MNVAILGTGGVAIDLAKGFVSRGHRVTFGTRDVAGERAVKALAAVPGTKAASYAEASKQAELAVIATSWLGTENALTLAGADNLAGKVVIDVTNPLALSEGKPVLVLGFPNSAGSTIQQWLPKSHVVKAWNIIPSARMIDPKFADGEPDMFIAGNDADAKQTVANLLKSFGWRSAIDMGSIDKSYLLEALAMVWIEYGVSRNYWAHGFSLLSSNEGK
jgi:8-hydroxy-5-deazaflavin:NADPH oxidoreductase